MPTRLLRDGILTSERVDALSATEEVFYRRLHSAVDDYGRYTAHHSLLRAALFPLKLAKVSDSDIGKWLLATEKAGLVRVYPASDGKRYLEVQDFGQRIQSKSKYPPPIDDSGSTVVHGESPGKTALVVVVVEDVCEDEDGKGDSPSGDPLFDGITDEVAKDFKRLRSAKKAPITKTAMAGIRREAGKAGLSAQQALETCCERGWTGFKAEWITGQAPGQSAPRQRRDL